MRTLPESIDVLHVDDDPALLEVVATHLERMDPRLEVTTADTPGAGLDYLDSANVDCIVSDYDMPSQDGITFLQTVRDRDPDLPFILYTGKGSEEVASEAISAGATDYLRKEGGTENYELLANRILNAVETTRSKGRASRHKRTAELVRTIQSSLVRATTQAEIDDAVCETLADAAPYNGAVIGDYEPATGRMCPRSSAGADVEAIEAIADGSDDGTVPFPVELPLEERSLHVFQTGGSHSADDGWEPVRETGIRSIATVPLVYDGTRYGVLQLAADRQSAFGPEERELLGELGETIAHALDRVALQIQYEEQYRELFENAPVMFAVTRVEDGELYIEDYNRQLAENLGYEPDELRGRPVADLYTDESVWKLREGGGTERALAGEFVAEERELLTSDGEQIPTILRASPRRSEDGEIIGVNSLYVDVSHRKRFEEVSEDRERLRQIIDLIPEWVFAKNRDGEYFIVNEAMADRYGTTPDGMVGKTDADFIDDEKAEQFRQDDLQVIESGTPKHIPEEHLTDAHGNEIILETTKIPFTITRTDTDAVLCYARNITDLKQRERELKAIYQVISDPERSFEAKVEALLEIVRKSLGLRYGNFTRAEDEELALVVSSSPDEELPEGVRVTDSTTICEYTMATGETYASADVPSDDPDLAARSPGDLDGYGAYLGTPVYLEGDIHGTLCFYDNEVREEAFSEWEVTLVDLVGQWVSYELGRERLTRDLAEKNERLEAFAGIVSHDLRNPLNVAEGKLALAREECDSVHLEDVARAHGRMAGLIEDILSVAQAPADRLELDTVELAPIVEASWDNVRTYEGTLDVAAETTIEADTRRLMRLFENVLRNAIEHGGEDATVTVGTLADGFYVEDDGPGIDETDRENVFETGYTTQDAGNGFGLSIVAAVADAHGWDVSVTESERGGARFEITGVETASD